MYDDLQPRGMHLVTIRHEVCATSVTKESGCVVAQCLDLVAPTLECGSGGAGRGWSGPAGRRRRRSSGQRILPETGIEPCSSNFSICQCVEVG